MIRILLIEDEAPALRKLKRFLEQVEEDVFILAEISTVAEVAEFLKNKPDIDLILSDIELKDGNIMEFYKENTLSVPVIFTTSYNQFLMEAFETSGIEYLLKPFSLERFQKAWKKYLSLRAQPVNQSALLQQLTQLLQQPKQERKYRQQFAVNLGRSTYFLNSSDIVFFRASDGLVFAIDQEGKKHALSFETLKEIEDEVDPAAFYRINRSELVHRVFIEKLDRPDKNAITISLKGIQEQLVTSQSVTAAFRDWLSL